MALAPITQAIAEHRYVQIAYHRQEALIDRQAANAKLDREAREKIAEGIISETVKATLGELYEMSENSKEEE